MFSNLISGAFSYLQHLMRQESLIRRKVEAAGNFFLYKLYKACIFLPVYVSVIIVFHDKLFNFLFKEDLEAPPFRLHLSVDK